MPNMLSVDQINPKKTKIQTKNHDPEFISKNYYWDHVFRGLKGPHKTKNEPDNYQNTDFRFLTKLHFSSLSKKPHQRHNEGEVQGARFNPSNRCRRSNPASYP